MCQDIHENEQNYYLKYLKMIALITFKVEKFACTNFPKLRSSRNLSQKFTYMENEVQLYASIY